jgi:hypothetical protein
MTFFSFDGVRRSLCEIASSNRPIVQPQGEIQLNMEMVIDRVKRKYFGNKGLCCEKPPSSCMSYGTAGASFQLIHFIRYICSYLSLNVDQ